MMNLDTVVKELIKEIPEIKPFYDRILKQWQGEELIPHIIFEDVLNSYLINLLEINENKELISRIFNYLEKITSCEYKKIQDTLTYLGYDKTILAKSQEYMGTETKKISYKIEKVLGKIMDIKEFWNAVHKQNAEKLKTFFKDTAYRNKYLLNYN